MKITDIKKTLPMENKKLLYLETFGCQMNVSDSEKIVSMLKNMGYDPTEDPSKAELIILNTCCVRAKAEHKLYSSLGRFKDLKKNNERLIVGVGGCVAQKEGDRLLKKAPFVNLVFGTHNLHLVPRMVSAAEQGQRLTNVDFIDCDTRLDLFPHSDEEGPVSRFVTIMQGCDNYCTYCIVPFVRGREISRRSSDIIDEISRLAHIGVREVTLLGQNVNSYGLKSQGECTFSELLHKVAAIDGIERIRFTTSHPKDLSPSLVNCFADIPKLCGHIHLPAQSGSDVILAKMERGYNREQYLEKIRDLKNVRPDIQITGDMIVGFPGETEEDFLQSLSLMKEVEYADQFSFIFSLRPETKAAGFFDDVSYKEKQERLSRLQTLQKQITLVRNKRVIGSTQRILVEGRSKRGDQLFGRTDGNRIVNFSGELKLVGSFVSVRITKAFQNSFLGELEQVAK
jgi:tRNA-2-methylthio-N6-dimethylallyladenosine synthase